MFQKRIALSVLGFALAVLTRNSVMGANLPALPKIIRLPRESPVTGKSIAVNQGGDLQAAINAANYGDEIVLQAGATFVGNFIIPQRTGTGWIRMRSSASAQLPHSGQRVGPGNAPQMAKIIGTSSNTPPISTDAGNPANSAAHNWWLIGIEITIDPSVSFTYDLVQIDSTGTASTYWPHDFILDRCYIHGNDTGEIRHGIQLGGTNVIIVGSYVSNIHGLYGSGNEAQAIYGGNGSGPYKIVNNYLEASTENVYFGGEIPTTEGTVASDIEFRFNYVSKPTSWRNGPTHWLVKNLFELKNAQRVLIDSNVFENCWEDGQGGYAFTLIPRSLYNAGAPSAPWLPSAAVNDVTFTNNVIRHVGGGAGVAGYDDDCPPGLCASSARMLFKNNLFYDLSPTWMNGGQNPFCFELGVTNDFTVEHTTCITSGQFSAAQFTTALSNTRETVTDSIFTGDFAAQNTTAVDPGPTGYFGDGAVSPVFSTTIVTGLPGVSSIPPWQSAATSSFFPATITFVDPVNGNYALATSSPYKGMASDGTDPGANQTSLNINGIISGSPLLH